MPDLEALTQTLTREGFAVSRFATGQEACAYLNRVIDGVSVGFGGSQSVRDLGLFEQLSLHNQCYWHWDKVNNVIPPEATNAQVYLCSVNALSMDGALVNIDGGGNRVASTLYGHQKVYFLVGSNKLAENYDAALWRARNIAAPLNAKRLERKTPCVKTGKCMNCSSPERICRALVVLWEKPALIPEVEIVLVDEPLGF
jgi:hypothetical protein